MTTPKEALEAARKCIWSGGDSLATVAIIDEALAFLQGEDAVERVARIRLIASKCFDPTGFEIDGTPIYAVAEWKAAESTLDAILATGLVPDEAAIRADEREKCAKVAEAECYATTGRQIAAAIRSNGRGA